MTLNELKVELKKICKNVEYNHFKKSISLPFIVYYVPNSESISADYMNFGSTDQVNIELYSSEKNIKLEKDIENILKETEYEKYESWIIDKEFYQVLYQIEIIEKY